MLKIEEEENTNIEMTRRKRKDINTKRREGQVKEIIGKIRRRGRRMKRRGSKGRTARRRTRRRKRRKKKKKKKKKTKKKKTKKHMMIIMIMIVMKNQKVDKYIDGASSGAEVFFSHISLFLLVKVWSVFLGGGS